MAPGLPWIASRLRGRPDSEHGQAIVRLSIALLSLAYLWWLQSWLPRVDRMAMVMLGESLVGMVLLGWILVRPGRSDLRRWIGMLADYSTLGILMSLSAQALAPLYVLIMWVTIGNGLRYGTLPLVRRVGGLADTVADTNHDNLQADAATGFVFEEASAEALGAAIGRAADAWADQTLWRALMQRAMAKDYSWGAAARKYLSLYRALMAQ